jgi:hypothetical protein
MSGLLGADGRVLIATYGTIRDYRELFSDCRTVLTPDLPTVTLGAESPVSEYVQADLRSAVHGVTGEAAAGGSDRGARAALGLGGQ